MKPGITKFEGIILGELSPEHPLRNRPLFEIGAFYRYKGSSFGKHKVKNSWRIAQKTFNDLGSSWTDNAIWYSTIHENPSVVPDSSDSDSESEP